MLNQIITDSHTASTWTTTDTVAQELLIKIIIDVLIIITPLQSNCVVHKLGY